MVSLRPITFCASTFLILFLTRSLFFISFHFVFFLLSVAFTSRLVPSLSGVCVSVNFWHSFSFFAPLFSCFLPPFACLSLALSLSPSLCPVFSQSFKLSLSLSL